MINICSQTYYETDIRTDLAQYHSKHLIVKAGKDNRDDHVDPKDTKRKKKQKINFSNGINLFPSGTWLSAQLCW